MHELGDWLIFCLNPNKKVNIDLFFDHKHTVSCPIKVSSNTIKLMMHNSCYCGLDLNCVNINVQYLYDRRVKHLREVQFFWIWI